MARANNQFAFDLYARLRGAEGNLFFSPHSLSTGLALAHAGARGDTARQIASVLNFSADARELNPVVAASPQATAGEGPSIGRQLLVINALWGQMGSDFLPEYLQILKERYGAELHEVDFAKSAEQSCSVVNAWTEKQTQGKVRHLLRPGHIDTQTRLVLTNAVYFKAGWASAFPKGLTREGPFHLGQRRTAAVAFMNQVGRFPYLENEQLQALELPYAGSDLTMVVFLPRSIRGLTELEKGLTAGRAADWVARLTPQEVEVAIPKLRMEAELDLKPTLCALGMPQAFDRAKADFSGMRSSDEPLFLSTVVHKAFVDIDEEGTEAAAATGAAARARSIGDKGRAIFCADHPFVFLIRDRRSGCMLFLGRFVKPQK
jgi:serpin B